MIEMITAKKITKVRLFTTPKSLVELAENMQKQYDNRNPGHSNVVETIVNGEDNIIIEICFDQIQIEIEEKMKGVLKNG